jgi:curved DNA-binding protein
MDFKDYYATLNVSRNATEDEIKRAYRKLARKFHPDVSKEADAEARFKEVGEAYEVLKDPEKRAAYDQLGANWKAGQEFRPPPGAGMGAGMGGRSRTFRYSARGGAGGEDLGGFSDFFETLFGGGGTGGGGMGGGGMGGGPRGAGGGFQYRQAGPMRGEDQNARIQVSLEDAFHGANRTLELRSPQSGMRTIRVAVPRGVTEGQRIRLAGQGAPGVNGGPAGDLFLEIGLESHPVFEAEGRNVLLTLPIAPWEAALGAVVGVPTLGGRVDLRIPAGSQSGRRLRLKGRGMPGKPDGDQIVTLRIDTPPADTDEARRLYEEMRDKLPFDPRRDIGG